MPDIVEDILLRNKRKKMFIINSHQQGINIPTDGLIAYYPFNGNANDESGNGYHGAVNGATLTTDRFGNSNSAYSFDGNDTINMGDVSAFNIDPISFSFWIYPTANGSRGLISKYNPSTPIGYFMRMFTSSNRPFARYEINRQAYSTTDYGIPLNEWIHLVFISNNGLLQWSIYLNGEEVAYSLRSASNTNQEIDADFILGSDNTGIANFVGKMDNLIIYNRILTEQEIISLYNE
jgi:hypothetical protein